MLLRGRSLPCTSAGQLSSSRSYYGLAPTRVSSCHVGLHALQSIRLFFGHMQEACSPRVTTWRTLDLTVLLICDAAVRNINITNRSVCMEVVGYLLEELRDADNFRAFKKDIAAANIFIGSLIFIEELAEKVNGQEVSVRYHDYGVSCLK